MSTRTAQTDHARPSDEATPDSGAKVAVHVVLALLVSIATFILFLFIREGIEDKSRSLTATDNEILIWMSHHQAPFLTEAARVLAFLGSPSTIAAVAVIGILVGVFIPRVRGAAITLPVAIVGAGLLIEGVKLSFHRARPTAFTPLLHATGYSFPSGHSVGSVVVYGLLGYFAMHYFRRRSARFAVGAVTVAFVLLVGVSRVYVGVHYPTDVLAGWSLGVPWLAGCILLHRRLARHYHKLGAPLEPTPAGT